MDISELLAFAVKNKASDLHLSSGLPPMIRVSGDIRRINLPPMEHKDVHRMVYDIMNDSQRKMYEETLETDFSFEIPSLARFRVNAFNQQYGAGAVFRTIPSKVLTLEELNCPPIFKEIANQPRGIVLVTGPTGSGKSTTLAAMMDYVNENEYGHILTVEDPIEFVHQSKKCLINQREVGPHTLSFNNALRSALREDPDVILVGELRDLETIRLALTAAETGHLVFGTLHTSSAAKTIDRVVDVFPAAEKEMVRSMLAKNASDLFITAGFPPAIKVDGKITPVSNQSLTPAHTSELAKSIMNEKQWRDFEATNESNFAISPPEIGRFRVNVFVQQGRVGIVMRTINTKIPKLEELNLPPVLKDVAMIKRGLVIFVGGTGTGKSTSLAALVGYRNENDAGHIITVEDPIEYVHDHKKSIVTQREVGIDTENWFSALKNTLRQAPDVILIGEIRDRDTMEYAIAFAETGHLCLSTLHANSANQALDRIINFFPEEKRDQLLMDLSLNLKAFVSQRLIPRKGTNGRVAAVEILLNSPLIADLIFKGQVHEIKEIMSKSRELGMQTFDQALFDLYEAGLVSYEDALRNADSLNDLRLKIKLHGQEAKGRDMMAGLDHLDIV